MKNCWCNDGFLTCSCISNVFYFLLIIKEVGAPKIRWSWGCEPLWTRREYRYCDGILTYAFLFLDFHPSSLYNLGCKYISSPLVYGINRYGSNKSRQEIVVEMDFLTYSCRRYFTDKLDGTCTSHLASICLIATKLQMVSLLLDSSLTFVVFDRLII